ncbi:hypothetical protein KC325_g168 [Hortaea werneckii]|nr:hypothetical protein KC325_g168 [Hortaea werneckii]
MTKTTTSWRFEVDLDLERGGDEETVAHDAHRHANAGYAMTIVLQQCRRKGAVLSRPSCDGLRLASQVGRFLLYVLHILWLWSLCNEVHLLLLLRTWRWCWRAGIDPWHQALVHAVASVPAVVFVGRFCGVEGVRYTLAVGAESISIVGRACEGQAR